MVASAKGQLSCIGYLVTHGAEVGQATHDGATALMSASKNGHLACVEYLTHSANVEQAKPPPAGLAIGAGRAGTRATRHQAPGGTPDMGTTRRSCNTAHKAEHCVGSDLDREAAGTGQLYGACNDCGQPTADDAVRKAEGPDDADVRLPERAPGMRGVPCPT